MGREGGWRGTQREGGREGDRQLREGEKKRAGVRGMIGPVRQIQKKRWIITNDN